MNSLDVALVAVSTGRACAVFRRLANGWGQEVANGGVRKGAGADWFVDLLGGLAVLVLSWLRFPAVAALIMGFFLDRVAAAVEALDYPGHEPPRDQPWGKMIAVTLPLSGTTIILNLLALPIYLLLPGINLVLFLALNGYLFGWGYFEVVTLRRLDPGTAKALRHGFCRASLSRWVAIAGLFALPSVDLLAPVIATAFMVHVLKALPRIVPL
ncbi:MAG TPA: EI24 domain-containing protein, partial [Stellaceae bacterium]|nr:EI24 domain-containing protein [Stellaceae bacterium]